jgi:micrococcal nuclease
MGDSVRVCGKVFSTRFLESANGTPTLINMGGTFPNEKLTIVIFGENRKVFQVKPEEAWKDKEICVTGRIVEYRGKPQIVVARPEQVEARP